MPRLLKTLDETLMFAGSERPIAMFEITLSVADGRALWRPDERCVALLNGVLGRTMALYDFELYGYEWLSTHAHLMIGVPDLLTKAAVLRHLNGNVVRETNRLRGRTGPLLARRNQAIQVADETAAVGRLKYIIGQATAAHVVARPAETPFASANPTLLKGEPIIGRWVDREAMYRAGPGAVEEDFVEEYEIKLSPLPHFRGDDAAYRRLCQRLADEVATEARDERRRTGRRLQSAQVARTLPPETRFESLRSTDDASGGLRRSPAPCLHGCGRARRAWRARYVTVSEGVRRATESWREFHAGLRLRPLMYPAGAIAPAAICAARGGT